jgi:DGQHR domain-containing protein
MKKKLRISVLRGSVLGVNVYRGYARLCDLALISKPDIYDQKNNPTGTQRDLSPKHAKEAYFYVKNNDLAFWPEVFLCIRNPNCFKYIPDEENDQYGVLEINMQEIERSDLSISRVDGNHRLYYADGKTKGFEAIQKSVSFCLAYDIDLTEEIKLFRDINNNQKRMNTSHLDNIEARLNPTEILKKKSPDLYIAQILSKDKKSPFYGRIYEGGKALGPNAIPLRSLKFGVQYMMSRTIKLNSLKDADAQAKVIINYFDAVKKWIPDAWNDPKAYLALRGVGLWGLFFIGATVIDKTLAKGEFSVSAMLAILKSGRKWDWSPKGDFQGLSGRGGAVKIGDLVTGEFQDDDGISVNELYKQIMSKSK